jgi:hypothetical protein
MVFGFHEGNDSPVFKTKQRGLFLQSLHFLILINK